jgi:hypothetical protein
VNGRPAGEAGESMGSRRRLEHPDLVHSRLAHGRADNMYRGLPT